MLVLSRLPDESIIIGTNIKVRVLSVRGNKVFLGIEAPKDIRVLREELADCREEDAGNLDYMELNLFECAGIALLSDWPKTLVFSTTESIRSRYANGFEKTLENLKDIATQKGYGIISDETGGSQGVRRITFRLSGCQPMFLPAS